MLPVKKEKKSNCQTLASHQSQAQTLSSSYNEKE